MTQAQQVEPAVSTAQADRWLRHALAAGESGPAVDPNPRVGAVIVSPDGELVGVGHHAGAGTPHAEIVALAQAGQRASGATAYVTLEPCAHTGRTGPCSQALLESGIAEVIYAVPDPGEASAGGGNYLATHRVRVTTGPDTLSAEVIAAAERLADPWLTAIKLGRPRVVWKFAATLDGRSAASDGTSQWITSSHARADVHDLRARCGAILVGTGTVVRDNPSLTARQPDGSLRANQPLRVVVGHRQTPDDAAVRDQAAPTVFLSERDPARVLAELHDRQIRQVLLEGGPTLAAAFWRDGLIDEVVAYLAPALLGTGPTAVGDLGIDTIADIDRLDITDLRLIGPDVRITAAPHSPIAPSEA